MSYSRYIVVLTVALSSAAQAQTQTFKPVPRPILSAADHRLLTRLTGDWQEYFQVLSTATLDMQWQLSWRRMADAEMRLDCSNHFWRGPGRHRLEIVFQSGQGDSDSYRSLTHLKIGQYSKDFIVGHTGVGQLTAKPYALAHSKYGTGLPLLELFGWASDAPGELTFEDFASRALWQNLARRVTRIEKGSWQGKSGWWMSVASAPTPQSQDLMRIFVDGKTSFPWLVTGTRQFETPTGNTQSTYFNQVTKTYAWTINGKPRLFPLDFVSRSWQRSGKTGERSTIFTTNTALATPKINQPIAPRQWELDIPPKTFVSYIPVFKTKPQLKDAEMFESDAQGGALWEQAKRDRERRAEKRKQLQALPAVYDEKADGETQISEAITLAASQNKGVLLQFGANWCPPCHVLNKLLKNDPNLAPIVKANYVTVSIDLNEKHNEALMQRLKGSRQGGIPFVVILDAKGNRIAAPPTEYFAPAKGDQAFDIEKLAAFLERWKPIS